MAPINSFDRGDSNAANLQSSPSSFFDWNTEMRAANSTRSHQEKVAPAAGGIGNEPDFIDFGDGTRTYERCENGSRIEYRSNLRRADKVEIADDREAKQTFRYDQETSLDEIEQQNRRQQAQLAEALQNFVRALTTLCMLYSRMLQQNFAGGNTGRYDDTGHGGYDMPTSGPDYGYNNPGYDAPAQPRPSRPRPQQPSAPRPPRNENSNPGSNPENGSRATEDSGSDTPSKPNADGNNGKDNNGNTGNDGGKTDSPSGSRYADAGIVRGRTIFRDDFNGARGEMPNQRVFDTAHIGPDGNDRQRGKSIDEDAITRTKNTVQDGRGHLQLFPQRERTWDPKANEYVNYTKGTYNTAKGLNFNLKDHPDGLVIEVRAKHPTRDGAKFNPLWIMTERWGADQKHGETKGDTIEYDAAEGGGADIAIHYPVKNPQTGDSKDNYGGGAHPKDIDFNDGNFHTYTVVIRPNENTGRGDVVQYVDGKKVFQKENVFPGDKDLHLKASMEVSPKWTHKTLTGPGGMDSDAAGVIDYVDVSELKRA